MITHLTSELNRINQGCGFVEDTRPNVISRICCEQWLCPTCQKEKETLKKVSLMWADEMSKIFDYEEPISKELQQIKSLIENQEDFQKLGSHEPSQMEKA
jgi:hypothetical protein